MRPDVARARCFWITRRQPFMRNHLEKLTFIDETSLKTNMIKTTGWAPRGQRLLDHTPFGHWNTQTFIAALRHNRLDAPWVIKGAMNRDLFNAYVRNPACANACAWRRSGPGQPFQPQKRRRRRSAEIHRRVVPVPTALQPRPEPHRNGILQAQSPDKKSRSPNLRCTLASRRTCLQSIL